MGSLSIDAGTPNEKSFFVQDFDSHEIVARSKVIGYSNFTNWVSRGLTPREFTHDIYQGRVLDNFHQRKNQGELLPYTPYRYVKSDLEFEGPSIMDTFFDRYSSGRSWNQVAWKDGRALPLLVALRSDTFLESANAEDRVLEAGIDANYYVQLAASKLYSQGWDALTFLAELHKTVRLFKSVVLNFAKLMDSFIRVRRYGIDNVVDQTFNQWLEGRYGWRILLYDIEDINTLLTGIDDKTRTRFKERTGQNVTTTNSQVENVLNFAHFHILRTEVVQREIKVRGYLIADFVPPHVITNLVTTGWELTRYSFVVDWILNVGAALNALSFLSTNSTYTAATGIEVRTQVWNTYECVPHAPATNFSSNWSQLDGRYTVVSRIRQPRIVPFIPHVEVNLDAFKVTDLIALIWGLLPKLT